MSISQLQGKKVPIHLWTPVHEVESSALDQLKNIAALPWVFHHVAVMPDVHFGKGATVGSVIAMKDAVSPAAVGVDIGCGMGAIKTSLMDYDLPTNLKPLRLDLEARIPVGFNEHAEQRKGPRKSTVDGLFRNFKDLHRGVQELEGKARKQLGTLGGGNHFIELCIDTNHCVWMVLHSGSRNIGKTLAEIHMKIARDLIHNQELPDRDLAVFLARTPEMEAYLRDLYWAQEYAFANRRAMFDIYKDIMEEHFSKVKFEKPILCHHNYVSEETYFGEDLVVTRKGAIRAGAGEYGIIPGSMGTKSYIVRGLGNEESFCSASHGAGRRMSRGKAKREFTLDDMIKQTEGVECRKDEAVLDEIPGAYKDIDQVMANQSDLVEIVAELKQVLCVKG
jgi:tRNA-splicing ligase RtcB